MVTAIALTLSSIAALSGILAVGSGRHWQFKTIDYFRGKRNAILYLWVIVSTIFSILLSGVIAQFGFETDWAMPEGHLMKWMAIHSVMAALLAAAHAFVAHTLSKEVGPVDKYLWGKSHRNV